MSVSCLCMFDCFDHLFHNVGGMDFPSIANLFVGCCYVFFCCFCSHFPNDDIAMRSDS